MTSLAKAQTERPKMYVFLIVMKNGTQEEYDSVKGAFDALSRDARGVFIECQGQLFKVLAP
jgi:hypothetical protein